MTLILVVFITYLLSAGLQVSTLKGRQLAYWPQALFTAIALIGHGVCLYIWIETAKGQNLDIFIFLSLTLWVMGLMLFALFKENMQSLNVIIYPLSALSVIAVKAFSGMHIVETQTDMGAFWHIIFSLVALSVLFLATCQALMLSLQHRLLKAHQDKPMLKHLPPLQSMERLLFSCIWVGMIFLTLSLTSGFVIFESLFAEQLFSKTLLSLLAWILFVILLIGRYMMGWRGPTAVKWVLLTSLILFLSYFGTGFLLR